MRLFNTRLRWLGVLALFVDANASQHALRHLRHRASIAVPELQKGRHVVVNGLVHSVELNGQEAVVEGYDAASARYVLRLASGAYRKVKQEHVTASSYSNSGQKGSPCTMEAGAGFAAGSQVRLHDLHSPGAAELNSELGLVRCFSAATGRYTVELSDGASGRRGRPEEERDVSVCLSFLESWSRRGADGKGPSSVRSLSFRRLGDPCMDLAL
ncbi:unnamed protein product [Symbiodinium sp. CCMP2592]|nr:unnamed protein product [Symbiodinium sp. CCMP2592]